MADAQTKSDYLYPRELAFAFPSVLSFRHLFDYIRVDGRVSPLVKNMAELLQQKYPEIYNTTYSQNYLNVQQAPFYSELQQLLQLCHTSLPGDNLLFAVIPPFQMQPIYSSEAFAQYFLDGQGIYQGRLAMPPSDYTEIKLRMAIVSILNHCYSAQIPPLLSSLNYISRERPNAAIDYFVYTYDHRFFRARRREGVPALSQVDLTEIQARMDDLDFVLSKIRPEDYILEGFLLLHATKNTASILLDAIKSAILQDQDLVSLKSYQFQRQALRDLMGQQQLDVQWTLSFRGNLYSVTPENIHRIQNLFSDVPAMKLAKDYSPCLFEASQNKEILIIGDLRNLTEICEYEASLLARGIHSLAIAPLYVGDQLLGFSELISPHPYAFSATNIQSVRQLVPILCSAVDRKFRELELRMDAYLREKCSAIHPSCEWKFKESAFHSLFVQGHGELADITFPAVYPLYGASDIRDSSLHRNQSIRADLLKQLELLLAILERAMIFSNAPILSMYQTELTDQKSYLTHSLAAGDEIKILKMIATKLNPLLPALKSYCPILAQKIEEYEKLVDPKLGFVYERRKAYDESVTQINRLMSTELERDQEQLQAILPHYFDKQQTDGVDYNIYMGSSLLDSPEKFNEVFVKNLRLWQLLVACRISHRIRETRDQLAFAMEVCHIVIVQNQPTSIRFQQDERKINVDGAYNIRYEIIKKRVDKATVKHTGMRLTQPDHIAIVYTHEEELHEYKQYLSYLQKQSFIEGEIEELALDDLQGVHGLKALRVKIHPQTCPQSLSNHITYCHDEEAA